MRECRTCGQRKPLSAFEKASGGYIRRECRECRQTKMKPWFANWRQTHRERLAAQNREYAKRRATENPPDARSAWQKWESENPGRRAAMRWARKIVYNSLQIGRIKRPRTCEQCVPAERSRLLMPTTRNHSKSDGCAIHVTQLGIGRTQKRKRLVGEMSSSNQRVLDLKALRG